MHSWPFNEARSTWSGWLSSAVSPESYGRLISCPSASEGRSVRVCEMAVYRNQTCTQERKQFCRDCRRRESDTPVACLILITRIPVHFITFLQGPTVGRRVGFDETDSKTGSFLHPLSDERTYVYVASSSPQRGKLLDGSGWCKGWDCEPMGCS